MSRSIEDQTLALAGVVQAAWMARQLAWQGDVPASTFNASVRSLFNFEPRDVPDVFGGPGGVAEGLKALRHQLSGTSRDVELTRYGITLLVLSGRFTQTPGMMDRVHRELNDIRLSMSDEALTSDASIRRIAALYRETISTLEPRIVVNGEQKYLEDEAIAARIRASLLAGIRAGMLWQQCGGSRLMLLFRRRKFMDATTQLLRRGLATV